MVSPLGASGLVGCAVTLIFVKSNSGGVVSGFDVSTTISAATSSTSTPSEVENHQHQYPQVL